MTSPHAPLPGTCNHALKLAAYLVVCALVLAQTLGLMHGVVHSPLAVARLVEAAPAGAAPVGLIVQDGARPESRVTGFLSALFAAHQHDTDCRIYDQSSHGDMASGVPALVLPLLLPSFVFSLLPGLATARWHALFQARGPPPVR